MKNTTRYALAAAALALPISGFAVKAATTTTTFGVSIVIEESCAITNATDLDFGTNSNGLSANTDSTSTISVRCTLGTGFDIGLNEGANGGVGADTTTRKMNAGTDTVDYQMFQNAGRTTNWGNTVSTDTVSGIGTGLAADYTVYGRVPVQTAAPAGTYNDTVTVTVTY